MAIEPKDNDTPPASQREPQATKTRYRWPLVVAGIVLLGVVLAMMWMSYEIRRTQRIRDANAPSTKP